MHCVAMDLGVVITTNIYTTPYVKPITKHLVDIIKQIKKPLVMSGDFNTNNTTWGSEKE